MKRLWAKLKSSWLFQSNHHKHIAGCFLGTLICSWGFGVGAGLAMEYKDKASGGKWDWQDILADAIGTVLGAITRHYIIGKF